jgi:hypothetical protein
MKRLLALVILPAMAAFAFGATADDKAKPHGKQNVYFGFLLGSVTTVPGSSTPIPRLAGVAIDLGAPDHTGQRKLRGYVCDGFGIDVANAPEGMAVWFKGVLPAKLEPSTFPLTIDAPGRLERLVITAVNEHAVFGTLIEATGATSQFAAYEAIDGAGIYEVTLDEHLHYTGTSTDGSTLDAQANPATGRTVGTIKPADGKRIDFAVRSLALATQPDLAAHGLSTEYPKYADHNQVPGEYVALIAPGGSHWFGRIGSIQFSTGITQNVLVAEIIGLDKKEFTRSTILK